MGVLSVFRSILLAAALIAVSGCASAQTAEGPDTTILVGLAHEYGRSNQGTKMTGTTTTLGQQWPPARVNAQDDDKAYMRQMSLYLADRKFDQLDKAAHDARVTRTRFSGGLWKLFSFYEAVSQPDGRDNASEGDWRDRIAEVKAWASAMPQSVTARIALAETYVNYAYKARGSGYADTVSEEGWRLYGSRIGLAAATLTDAAQLKEKCPYWYEAMQHVALAQGWDKTQARDLFEQAVAFEPSYYHFYREYANFLLPKWYGEIGEAGTFADEMASRIGGQEGRFLYFEIASLVRCGCGSDNDPNTDNLSWPRIKEGYVVLGQLYGYSNLKDNRFARMSYEAGDREAALKAFALIGSEWDPDVWHSARTFESARDWARSTGGQ